MKDSPKIQLSPFEQQLAVNYEWLLTKNHILEKIRIMLADLQRWQQEEMELMAATLPAEARLSPAKISKGENYQGLPYLVLDQPRIFEKDHTFAVRTMFWWGHFFSITLQLSGRYQAAFAGRLGASFGRLQKEAFCISHSRDAWDHRFEKDNYTDLQDLQQSSFIRHIQEHPFIKIAKRIPLDNWDTIPDRMRDNFSTIMTALGSGKTE